MEIVVFSKPFDPWVNFFYLKDKAPFTLYSRLEGIYSRNLENQKRLSPLRSTFRSRWRSVIMNQFWLREIFSIFLELLIASNTRVQLNRYKTVQDFLTLLKNHQKEWYSLDDSIYDFLLHYNDRFHSATKVVPCKAVINVID